MSGSLYPVGLFIFVLLFNLCVTYSLGTVAKRSGLVDEPDGKRKHHAHATPVVGGLAIFISLACAMAVFDLSMPHLLTLAAVIMIVGALDDISELGAKHRFAAQIAVCGMLAATSDYQIRYLGDLLGFGSIAFQHDFPTLIFTLICLAGVVNSTNMLDGIDGLCAGVCGLSFVAIGLHAWHTESFVVAGFCAAVAGSIASFLLLNLGALGAARKVFLGDAGSMMLGLLLAAVLVKITQTEGAQLRTVTAGWIVALPIIDTVCVMVRRAVQGGHPFRPGTDHVHHNLLSRGWSHRRVLVTLLGVQAALISIGFMGEFFQIPEAVMFWLFVAIVIAYFGWSWNDSSVAKAGRSSPSSRLST